jgi:hypothetical protein
MITEENKQSFWFALILILFAAATRFIPGTNNFTAVGAMALFSGAVFRNKKYAFLLPIIAMFMSDIFLGFHFGLVPVYACFAFTVWMGCVIRNKISFTNVLLMSLLCSVVFYLITNLPFWYTDIQLYPNTLQGTFESYTNALPFFRNQLAGDLFYNALLFSLYFFVFGVERKYQPIKATKK